MPDDDDPDVQHQQDDYLKSGARSGIEDEFGRPELVEESDVSRFVTECHGDGADFGEPEFCRSFEPGADYGDLEFVDPTDTAPIEPAASETMPEESGGAGFEYDRPEAVDWDAPADDASDSYG